MNLQIIIYIVGYVLRIEGLAMLVPFGVGLIYHEQQAWSFLIVAAACFLIGVLLTLRKNSNQVFFAKEGFIAVALAWIFMSIFGALPFVINGDIPNFTNAFFETVSGFTTTGSSILTDVESLARCSLFWRSGTHFIGGMGVLVLILCLLPSTNGAAMHLMRAESPGPQVGKVVPKLQNTAVILYVIYVALTVFEMILLMISGMPVFDSIVLSMGTAGTGGFALHPDGLGSYAAASQYIVSVFMILFGINFNVYFFAARKRFKDAFRCEEARWYLGVIAVSVGLITWCSRGAFRSLEETFRAALFQVGSVITTTGYCTVDFDKLYPTFAKVIMLLLMFCGACAGSTGGGVKVSRLVLLGKSALSELSRVIHPRRVKKLRLEGRSVEQETLHSVHTFMIAYFSIFFISSLIIALEGESFTTTFTSVLATLNNIGPGLERVGPFGGFSAFSPLSKWVFSFNMLAGRLEIFPLLVLLSPGTWKQSFKRLSI